MTGDAMTADDLRKLYWTDPFRPFVLELADGRRLDVREREWMAISPANNQAVVAPTILEMEFIDFPAEATVRFTDDAVPAAANGAA